MARSQPAQKETLDFLPVLIGAALIGVFYLPGFRGLLGLLLFVGLALVVAMLTLATGAAIWRHKKGQAAELARSAADFFSPPAPFIERDETPPASETILESESSDETSLESPPESEQVEADRFEEDAPLAPERPPPPLWLTWRLELLQAVEWRRFADVVTAYHCELGREARITRIGSDGVVEIEMIDRGTGQTERVVRSKAWDIERVGLEPVWEFSETLDFRGRAGDGAFFTAGEYTQEALIFARENNLDLVDGREFLSRILQLPPSAQNTLYAIAAAGDNTTPTCPNCAAKMVLRLPGKGLEQGRDSWSFRNYPRCTQTFKVFSFD